MWHIITLFGRSMVTFLQSSTAFQSSQGEKLSNGIKLQHCITGQGHPIKNRKLMGCISDYRKFTFSLCEQLSQNDLDSMKFLLRDLLTTREIEGVGKPEHLFVLLEQRKELGDDNFRLLEELFTQIKRQDLVRKLNGFEREQLAKRPANYDIATEDSRALNNTTQTVRDCSTDEVEKEVSREGE